MRSLSLVHISQTSKPHPFHWSVLRVSGPFLPSIFLLVRVDSEETAHLNLSCLSSGFLSLSGCAVLSSVFSIRSLHLYCILFFVASLLLQYSLSTSLYYVFFSLLCCSPVSPIFLVYSSLLSFPLSSLLLLCFFSSHVFPQHPHIPLRPTPAVPRRWANEQWA